MTENQLRDKIKIFAKKIYKEKFLSKKDPSGYDSVVDFPSLRDTIIGLLTEDFVYFIEAVNWVAPKPTTFYIELKNGFGFYLIYGDKSWIAQVEGKRYYLLNQSESDQASKSISRLLRYEGKTKETTEEEPQL